MIEKKTILFVTDFDANGSGYRNISIPFLDKMVDDGHTVIVLGMHYSLMFENTFRFHLIPVTDINDTTRHILRLEKDMKIDALIIAADLLYHRRFLAVFEQAQVKTQVSAIFPVESPPMAFSWMLPLTATKHLFCYSKFGTEACKESGFDVTYLPVGVNREVWKKHSDKADIYNKYGKRDDDFIILTVADNQERKNLTNSIDIVKGIQDRFEGAKGKNVVYYLVTRENNLMGYALRDYAREVGLKDFEIVERGIDEDKLCEIYNLADLFLLVSKAEGLGMPILESFSCGVPVAGINACAIEEHLQGGKNGITLPYIYKIRDMYNNGFRYFVDVEKSVDRIMDWYSLGEKQFDVDEYLAQTDIEIGYKVLMDTLFGDEHEQK